MKPLGDFIGENYRDEIRGDCRFAVRGEVCKLWFGVGRSLLPAIYNLINLC